MKFIKTTIKFFGLFILIFILSTGILYLYCLITPKIEISKEQSYYLYDKDKSLIFNNNKDWISLDDISPYLIEATINTEDKHFYHHIGFDYFRIAKSLFNNIKNGSLNEGASTITMQYARNLFLNYEKTWKRKLDEALLAFELETHYSKDEILEGYLNTINYGGVFGIENASKYYFNKSASDLTLAEATMLAGIPQSPSNNNPIINEQNAKKRQQTVLSLMVKNKKISNNDKIKALNTKLNYYGKINESQLSMVMYFKDAVMEELNNINSIPDSVIETGGLRIYTTLSIEAQQKLEEATTANLSNTNLQVAGIMTDSKNNGVLALIGGTDYNKSQFNRAIKAKRQVGSTIKPILYYSALESGFTSSSSFTSEKTTFTLSSNKTYTPKNYNDTYANGPISMGAAISYSDNVYAVKTHLFLGEDMLINNAKRLGITSPLKEIASLALGTCEISLEEMVNAYNVFANLGIKNDIHFINKIEDNKGNIIYEYKPKNDYILNSSLVFILNEMLTYTYDTSFIDYNYPTIISLLPKMTNKYAVKSGTTNTDYWIIGYNPQITLGIWTGYDNNSSLTNDDISVHKNIWINTMENYFKNKDVQWYKIPDNVVGVAVNPITGNIVKEGEKSKIFYYLKGTEPTSDNKRDLEEVFKEDIKNNSIKEDNNNSQ